VETTRTFQAGDVVELRLPVEPRFTSADARVDAVRGCVAVERGPEVLCLESVDLEAVAHVTTPADLSLLAVDVDTAPREVGGHVVVRVRVESERPLAAWPYRDATADDPPGATEWAEVPLVPYHDWANRGPSTMRVWLPSAAATPPS